MTAIGFLNPTEGRQGWHWTVWMGRDRAEGYAVSEGEAWAAIEHFIEVRV